MRTLSAAALAAVDAVITAPGHLVELQLTPTPARWSDAGQVTATPDITYADVDMKLARLAIVGDAAQPGFSITLGNLDSAIGALLLGNDLANAPVQVWGFDRAAILPADFVNLGIWSVTSARIGIDTATLNLAPVFYTAPFRRVDPANGFKFATPEGTKISWGRELTIFQQSRWWDNPHSWS